MQSNPIQQRIELIGEKWEDAKVHRDARIACIRCQPDELEMVDTFYTYMIAVDTPISDIGFHFESECTDVKTYSESLLHELEEIMFIWNNSEKDQRIDDVKIDWQADRALEQDKNPAALFVLNFNRLAKAMNLQEGLCAVPILKTALFNKSSTTWLRYAIEAGIAKEVKFLVHDTIDNPLFDSVALDYSTAITFIPIKLNMARAMEQAAAMGDPNDPATAYRQAYMKMVNAMTEQKENAAEKAARACIKIAEDNLEKDPYWICQVVVVYIALGNDKIRYKKKQETLAYANKAVETATAAQEYFQNGAAAALLAQAVMFRGTILYVQSVYGDAYTDFNAAYELYRVQGNLPLAIEAGRLGGKSAIKNTQKANGIALMANAAKLGKSLDRDTARASTYAPLLEALLDTNHDAYISAGEIEETATFIYGPEWRKIIHNWNKVPDRESIKQEEQLAAAANG